VWLEVRRKPHASGCLRGERLLPAIVMLAPIVFTTFMVLRVRTPLAVVSVVLNFFGLNFFGGA